MEKMQIYFIQYIYSIRNIKFNIGENKQTKQKQKSNKNKNGVTI